MKKYSVTCRYSHQPAITKEVRSFIALAFVCAKLMWTINQTLRRTDYSVEMGQTSPTTYNVFLRRSTESYRWMSIAISGLS